MNEKLTLPEITAELAVASGRSKKLSEDFIREFFALISLALENGESVRIKGIGTFKLSDIAPRKSVSVSTGEEVEIPSHRRVTFIPAKELASAVNAGFEMFDTVELSDSVTDEMLEAAEAESVVNVMAAVDPVLDLLPEPEEELTDPQALDAEFDKAVEQHAHEEIASEVANDSNTTVMAIETTPSHTEETEYVEENQEPEYEIDSVAEPRRSGRRFIWGWLMGFLTSAALFALAWFLLKYYSLPPFDAMPEAPVKAVAQARAPEAVPEAVSADTLHVDTVKGAESESVKKEAPATQPSDKKVYDTIGKTRYLTTMAKEHYGNYHLWPYIYEENKAFLGHPDRIRPGTKVVVPPLSKYGVDAHNPADIAKAKRMGVEIYSRFKQSR